MLSRRPQRHAWRARCSGAIRVNSRGSILFVQDRVGWNGRVFRMYKFLTMTAAPEAESDRRRTESVDPRVTCLGHFLRRYSLDELPQILSMLMGGISVSARAQSSRTSSAASAARSMNTTAVINSRWASLDGRR